MRLILIYCYKLEGETFENKLVSNLVYRTFFSLIACSGGSADAGCPEIDERINVVATTPMIGEFVIMWR